MDDASRTQHDQMARHASGPLRRYRWWLRLGIAVLVLPWLGRFAYTRYTTMPARTVERLNWDLGAVCPSPDVDRSRELLSAINAIPAWPVVKVPPPAPMGYRWVRIADQNRGPSRSRSQRRNPSAGSWGGRSRKGGRQRTATASPIHVLAGALKPLNESSQLNKRYLQSQAIAYLQRSDVSAAMDRIAELSDEPFCLRSPDPSKHPIARASRITNLFAARARTVMVETRDLARAMRDIQTLLQLAAGIEDDYTVLRLTQAMNCRIGALAELIRWCHEYDLPLAETRDVAAWLNRHPFDRRHVWKQTAANERRLVDYHLDKSYTRDEHSNGWYVVHPFRRDKPLDHAMRLLNLASPLFDDRNTARNRIHWQIDLLAEMVDLPPRQPPYIWRQSWAMTKTDDKPTAGRLDKWVEDLLHNAYSNQFVQTGVALAMHRGAPVALAISAYHGEHGRYPTDLSALVPDYLDEIPIDPFSGKPLRYRLDKRDGFVLYSLGYNCTDDGGICRSSDRRIRPRLDYDAVLNRPRPYVADEWVLVPE